jgi:hypothetical protein
VKDDLIPRSERETYADALEAYNDAGLTSGQWACEHYLCALATLALYDFRYRMERNERIAAGATALVYVGQRPGRVPDDSAGPQERERLGQPGSSGVSPGDAPTTKPVPSGEV